MAGKKTYHLPEIGSIRLASFTRLWLTLLLTEPSTTVTYLSKSTANAQTQNLNLSFISQYAGLLTKEKHFTLITVAEFNDQGQSIN